MTFQGLNLFIPEKPDAERDAVAKAWEASGGNAIKLGRFWDPPLCDPQTIRLYGNISFCMVHAQKFIDILIPATGNLSCIF